MSKEGVALFRQCIHKDFRLKSEDGEWLLEDNWELKLRPPLGSSSELFHQLDKKKPSPFHFFSESPPKHVAKMCDAIIALSHQDRLYIFLVEQKKGKKGDYRKQLKNGKYFCDWLLVLLREYGHYKDPDPVFIGLRCVRRSLARKKTVMHGKNDEIDKIEDNPQPLDKLYKVSRETIHLARVADTYLTGQ